MDDLREQCVRVRNELITKGQQSCATTPWTYRTDTGDEHGKVVESAELPEKISSKEILGDFNIIPENLCNFNRYGTFQWYDQEPEEYNNAGFDIHDWYVAGEQVTDDWLRKHLIAWAEINK